jgi:hypothetical protein
MLLSALRVRLIYSRLYKPLRRLGLGPLEAWIYRKLRAPLPLRGPKVTNSPAEGRREKSFLA